MSSINIDLVEAILSEKHPTIQSTMIQRLIKESTAKSFEDLLKDVESKITYEEQKEITPPLKNNQQRRHILDFRRNW